MTADWMKKGDEGAEAFKQNEAETAAKIEASSDMWRFRLKRGEEAEITFVDGNLTPAGNPDWITLREHSGVFMNGSYNNNFVCIASETQPCPVCESGHKPSFVAVTTVIDHREVPSTKHEGKVYKDQPRLFVAKPKVIKKLTNIAVKRGGLTGLRIEVTRPNEKTSSASYHPRPRGSTCASAS